MCESLSTENCEPVIDAFHFEFEDEKPNRITFDYSPEADEEMDSLVENGVPILYANRAALLTLARLFIKMAKGPYEEGFHVHLRKDLDADEDERLIVMLHSAQGGSSSDRDGGTADDTCPKSPVKIIRRDDVGP